jgi:hypothetical protein
VKDGRKALLWPDLDNNTLGVGTALAGKAGATLRARAVPARRATSLFIELSLVRTGLGR